MSRNVGPSAIHPASSRRADDCKLLRPKKQAQKIEGLLQVSQQHGVQENREATKFPAPGKADSTTEPPAPSNPASRGCKLQRMPIDRRKTARRLGHSVATPEAQQSMYESVIHAVKCLSGFNPANEMESIQNNSSLLCFPLRPTQVVTRSENCLQASCEILRIRFGKGKSELAPATKNLAISR